MALLLVAAVGLLWLFVLRHGALLGFAGLTKRAALTIAFALFQLLTVVIMEVTSIGHHLTRSSVTVAWIVVVIVVAVATFPDVVRLVRQARRPARIRLPAMSLLEWAALGAILGIFGCLVATALLYRPSNTDSMAYHLARIEHWIQDRSVASFPAHWLAQIELAPLAEYNLATLHLLQSSDRLDGFVELTAAAICVVGASELARRLGLSRYGQVLTAVLVATIPSLILEATSTTNNVFAAAVAVTALVVITSPMTPNSWLRRGVAVGVVLALLELAKGTLLPEIAPILVVLGVAAAVRGWLEMGLGVLAPRVILGALLAAGTAALIAGPFLARNVALFGSPVGPLSRLTIEKHPTLAGGAGNVIRSASAQFLIGNGHDVEHDVSVFAVGSFRRLYDLLGQNPTNFDYELGPNPSAFHSGNFSVLTRFEDVGADPWQVVLILVSLMVLGLGVMARRTSLRFPLVLAIAASCGFILFTGAARWSIYANRYYIPLLVIWTPLIALVLSRVHRVIGLAVVAFLLVACAPQVFDNYSRPLLHPFRFTSALEPYFITAGRKQAVEAKAAAYADITRTVARSSCRQVGLANLVYVEYPVWVGLKDAGWHGTVSDIDVLNASRVLERKRFSPCALIEEPDQIGYSSNHAGMDRLTFGPLMLFIDPAATDSGLAARGPAVSIPAVNGPGG
jgi:hypothetical protein